MELVLAIIALVIIAVVLGVIFNVPFLKDVPVKFRTWWTSLRK